MNNIGTLNIILSTKYILSHPNYQLNTDDFPNIQNVNILVNNKQEEKVNELDKFLGYSVLKNNKDFSKLSIYGNNITPTIRKKYQILDNKFNEIIDSFNFNDYTTPQEKIVAITTYVANIYNFDKTILNYLLSLNDYNKDFDIEEKMMDYEKNIFQPLISPSKTAISANYAALVNILCYKCGIESYYVEGIYKDTVSFNHTWNVIKLNNRYYYLDTAILDFKNDFEAKNFTEKLQQILININSNSYNNYTIIKNVLQFNEYNQIIDTSLDRENTVYYNEEAPNYILKYNDKVELSFCSFTSIFSALLFLGVIKELNNEEKNKYLNHKTKILKRKPNF